MRVHWPRPGLGKVSRKRSMAVSAPALIEAPRAPSTTDPEADRPVEQRVARWLVYATLIGMAVVGGTIALFLFKGFYIDWLWFGSVGFQQPYLKILLTKTLLFTGALLLSGALLIGNVKLARRTAREDRKSVV